MADTDSFHVRIATIHRAHPVIDHRIQSVYGFRNGFDTKWSLRGRPFLQYLGIASPYFKHTSVYENR